MKVHIFLPPKSKHIFIQKESLMKGPLDNSLSCDPFRGACAWRSNIWHRGDCFLDDHHCICKNRAETSSKYFLF